MAEVSIIVPFHNSEKTLDKCLYSIHEQSYKDFEVILVDDASDDSSYDLCSNWIKKDNRFKLFKNTSVKKGVSVARNLGLLNVKTKLVTFIDSDDWVESFHIQNLVKTMEHSDLGIVGMGNNYDPIKVDSLNLNVEDATVKILVRRDVSGYLCNKIYKSDLIFENNLEFDENTQLSEDLLFNIKYLQFCYGVKYIKLPSSYHYVRRNDSVTKEMSGNIMKWVNEYETVKKIDQNLHIRSRKVLNAYLSHKVITANNLFNRISETTKEENIKCAGLKNELRYFIFKSYPIFFFCKYIKIKNKISALSTIFFPKIRVFVDSFLKD